MQTDGADSDTTKDRFLKLALGLFYLCTLMVLCEATCAACQDPKQGEPYGLCCQHDQSPQHTRSISIASHSLCLHRV